jgi:nucleoside-diphosphate-sugar epimerase
MKILITGLSGFIGGYLNKRFNSKYEIYDLGCNLLEFDKVKDRLHEVNPDFIIHLAARTEVEKSFYEQTTFSQINYTGTVNLIESSKDLSNLKLCIFSSTMETYGWQPESDLIKEHKHVGIPVFNETNNDGCKLLMMFECHQLYISTSVEIAVAPPQYDGVG